MQHTDIIFTTQLDFDVGDGLVRDFHMLWPAYFRWFQLSERPISAEVGRAKILEHMPELMGTFDLLCQRLHAQEQAIAFLSLFNPPRFPSGCSQLSFVEASASRTLIRNYDFPATLSERKLLLSNWNGTRVIAMTDCIWGVLDGINEHGLAVSLAYGGGSSYGEGFAITLVLRYVLEFCQTVAQAITALKRIPVHMTYNVTLLDKQGITRTVELSPVGEARVNAVGFATNHQHSGLMENLETVADSSLRETYIATRSADPNLSLDAAIDMFLKPPLYRNARDWRGWGTLYTACYDTENLIATLYWPNGQCLRQGFEFFSETTLFVDIPAFHF